MSILFTKRIALPICNLINPFKTLLQKHLKNLFFQTNRVVECVDCELSTGAVLVPPAVIEDQHSTYIACIERHQTCMQSKETQTHKNTQQPQRDTHTHRRESLWMRLGQLHVYIWHSHTHQCSKIEHIKTKIYSPPPARSPEIKVYIIVYTIMHIRLAAFLALLIIDVFMYVSHHT